MTDFEQWKGYFIATRQPALTSFYEPISGSRESAVALVERCRDLQHDRKPLRIMNAIERLGTLSQEMATTRTPRMSLTVLFLVICIETIYSLADIGPNKKVQILIDFFQSYILPEDQSKLLGGIRRSMADDIALQKGPKLSLEIIARLVNQLRNLFVHEGDDCAFSFAHEDHGCLLNVLSLKEADGEQESEHSYDVTITLTEFQNIVLRGCANFLQQTLQRVAP